MTRFKKFILNGLLITLVSLLIRTVSVSFNVYISNRIGAVAMGLFTLISTVYGFAITVATSGIGLATTRIVAEAFGKSESSHTEDEQLAIMRCIVKKCVIYALCFSVGSGLILFLFAPTIGLRLLSDERTVMPLRVLAITLPPIALSSVLSGYFVAVRRVYKNALVQIFGQAIRIFACIAFLSLLCAKDVESACLAVILGGVVSELSSFLFQFLFYLFEKKVGKSKSVSSCEGKKIEKRILRTALPVAFSAYVRSGLITVEHMLIPWGLEKNGVSRNDSLAAYGTVQSMVFPMVLFPSALTGSFAGLLVPEIAQSHARNDAADIERIIGKVFQAVLIFAIGTAGILMCFSYELAHAAYPHTQHVGKYILMIAPLVPVMYLDTSVDSILKGLGDQVYCMAVNIVDALLSVILVWILLPKIGLVGYIITVYFTELVNATLSIARLFYVTKVKTHPINWVVKPLLAIVLATGMIRFLLTRFVGSIESTFQLIAHITLTVMLYLLLLLLAKVIPLPKK